MSRIAQLQKMLAAEPGDPFVLYGLAQEYAKAGEMPRAIETYDRCLASDPQYLYAYFHKARALESLGRTADAVATLRTGAEASRQARDAHAEGEIRAYMDELS